MPAVGRGIGSAATGVTLSARPGSDAAAGGVVNDEAGVEDAVADGPAAGEGKGTAVGAAAEATVSADSVAASAPRCSPVAGSDAGDTIVRAGGSAAGCAGATPCGVTVGSGLSRCGPACS